MPTSVRAGQADAVRTIAAAYRIEPGSPAPAALVLERLA